VQGICQEKSRQRARGLNLRRNFVFVSTSSFSPIQTKTTTTTKKKSPPGGRFKRALIKKKKKKKKKNKKKIYLFLIF